MNGDWGKCVSLKEKLAGMLYTVPARKWLTKDFRWVMESNG